MPYNKTEWQDRVVEKPRTYQVTNNPDGTITLTPAPGTVVQAGTPVNATNMNNLETQYEKAMEDMGSETFTVAVGESVQVGDIIEICGNGSTVRRVKTLSENEFVFSVQGTDTPSSSQYAIDKLADGKYIYVYQTGSGVSARVLLRNADGSWTLGTGINLSTSSLVCKPIGINANSALLRFYNGSNYQVAAAQISGTVITKGASIFLGSSSGIGVALTDTTVVVFIPAGSSYSSVMLLSVSGTTVSQLDSEIGPRYVGDQRIVKLDSTSALVFYRYTNDNSGQFVHIKNNGGTLTLKESNVLSNVTPLAIAALANNKALILYKNRSNNYEMAAYVNINTSTGTVTLGNTTSYGKVVSASWGPTPCWLNENQIIIFSHYSGQTSWYYTVIDVSGTSPAIVTEWGSISLGFTPFAAHSVVDAFNDGSDFFIITGDSPWTKNYFGSLIFVDSPKIIGVATKAASSGQSTTVKVFGRAKGLSGLTPGQKYYPSSSGSLTTTKTTFEVGIAVSATELLLTLRPMLT